MTTQSCVLALHLKDDMAADINGKYGRMFAELPCHDADEAALLALGRSHSVVDSLLEPDTGGSATDNAQIAAGFPIFGQFIAHDITADRSLLQHHANLNELQNFRTPQLDLESVYGSGPGGSPYLYDVDDPDKFLLGKNDAGRPDDLPRNWQGVALIGDPRNDVHLIISQLHLAFLKFHNRIVDLLRAQGTAPAEVFSAARRLVCWHYQWIVIHEFLPLNVGPRLVADVLEHGRRFYDYGTRPYIPVEFADAAYRFGHSQIRATYRLNDNAEGRIFPDLGGRQPVPAERVIDWRYIFAVDAKRPPQPSKRIDSRMVHALIDLPTTIVGETDDADLRSLACRDLQRGRALDLPSGEAVARVMGVPPLTADECGLRDPGLHGETPLWFYIVKEAEVRTGGARLGAVGGRIVAEVLIGLIDGDPDSYLGAAPGWRPTLPSAQTGDFTMADLLRFAGVA
jgi:Animal haem peroxidase